MKLFAVVLFVAIFAKSSQCSQKSAMDAIVVEQADGSFKSSPFYVRFDKSDAGRSKTKVVDVKVNGKPVALDMRLENNGEAFFARGTTEKTLQLTSEQIRSLNLTSGKNEMEFNVGNSRCKCNVFRWKYTDKVVVSDIGGTITQSCILGAIASIVGSDWTQPSVAKLFSRIEQNGYKFMYFSDRSIVKSSATRDYMRNIKQGDSTMPDGPVILKATPFRSEREFKIACLNGVAALFPECPFHAGFGNHINGKIIYSTVGIPNTHIFTINTNGKVKQGISEKSTLTFKSLTNEVDALYPPIIWDETEDLSTWNTNILESDILNETNANITSNNLRI